MSQDLKKLPVGTFDKTIRSRLVSRNESLLYSILRTNISEDLVLKLRGIVSKKYSRSRVRANQMRDKNLSNRHCGLVAKLSKNDKTTKVIDKDKDVDRALSASRILQEVETNNIKGSSWKWILQNSGRGSSTFCLGAGEAT